MSQQVSQIEPISDRASVLSELRRKVSPVVLAQEKTFPISSTLGELFPSGGLVLGSTTRLTGPGATTVGFSLLAEATAQGAWASLLGVGNLGWDAMAQTGASLQRTLSVALPRANQWVQAMAAAIDSFDVVVFDPLVSVRERDARRIVSRVRERGTVLIEMSVPDGRKRFRWPTNADQVLSCEPRRWDGLGNGFGTLDDRVISVRTDMRRGRGASVDLLLSEPKRKLKVVPAESSYKVWRRNVAV